VTHEDMLVIMLLLINAMQTHSDMLSGQERRMWKARTGTDI